MAATFGESILGRTVKAVTEEAVYVGVVYYADTSEGKLSLRNVTVGEDCEELNNVLHLSKTDILDLDIVDGRKNKENKAFMRRRRMIPKHLEVLRHEKSNSDKQAGQVAKRVSSDPYTNTANDGLSENHKIIHAVDQSFRDAIAFIKSLTIIGVSFKGIRLGRFGQLCWVLVSAADQVYLFDILRTGKDCFDAGLGDILSHSHILKVIHNCRQPSDVLFHQYGVELRNVFDTQVADVFLDRRDDQWPRYAQGLPCCVLQHLQLQPSEVNITVVRQNCIKDQNVWAERPCRLLGEAVKDVIHLRRLRVTLIEKMMSEYTKCVDIYLNYARRAPPNVARSRVAECHLVPREFQDLADDKSWQQRRSSTRAKNSTNEQINIRNQQKSQCRTNNLHRPNEHDGSQNTKKQDYHQAIETMDNLMDPLEIYDCDRMEHLDVPNGPLTLSSHTAERKHPSQAPQAGEKDPCSAENKENLWRNNSDINEDSESPVDDPKLILASKMAEIKRECTPSSNLILRASNYKCQLPVSRSKNNQSTRSQIATPLTASSRNNYSEMKRTTLHSTVGAIRRDECSVSFQKFGHKTPSTINECLRDYGF